MKTVYGANRDPSEISEAFLKAADRVFDKIKARAKFKERIIVYVPPSGIVRATAKMKVQEIPEWRLVGVYDSWNETFSQESLYEDIKVAVASVEEVKARVAA